MSDRLRAAVYIQLAEDIGSMLLHRAHRDDQLFRNRLVRVTPRR